MTEQEQTEQLSIESISEHIFRAYDIRGIAYTELTTQAVTLIGKALGSLALDLEERTIVVARDGRLSGFDLMQSLKEGVLSSGCDVVDIGIVPTPVLYYAAQATGTGSGVMLTGSHNPKEYNGIKMVIAGRTLAQEDIQNLLERIKSNHLLSGCGNLYEKSVAWDYINCVANDIKIIKPLKVVVDAGNGVAGSIVPQLLETLGVEVVKLYCDVDGNFPNHHPDPARIENLQDLISVVKQEKADVGLAFDGDGDRLGVVTPSGNVIDPDRQLMLYSLSVLRDNPEAKILFDVKCTKNLAPFIKEHGGEPVMYKTGHALIKRQMKALNALLAGEMSGHIFFNDRWFGFDDALYVAARLLETLSNEEGSIDQLFESIPDTVNTPEIMIQVDEIKKFPIVEKLQKNAKKFFSDATDIITIDGVRVEFEHGWGLVRASNTTPCLSLRFEADTEGDLHMLQNQFRAWMLEVDDTLSF
ncbi:phosphomannomutase/phosphoglucomutase [Thiotrichales bacterium 19S11-10]|nr:phosphomannomutase/phosphoglucomutase [Thiotrichales bacterium 19S11-10]MCF6807925.1 phosphomannomutase/phosphoglucomutase [Thiotrichales bacterium 19S9-11]MCF6811940.1 phosphomannomutase/phosphoglucomutase [Thiotrichales bacterium 19S9-12]